MATESNYQLYRLLSNVCDIYAPRNDVGLSVYDSNWNTSIVGDNYVLEAVVVGLNKENLKVTVVDSSLVVEGTPSVKSRYAKAFKHSWGLVDDADINRIDARLENGLLTVTIPKVKPVVRNIDVTVQ